MKFNLLDEPWLPCYDLEGRYVELGIRETLARAHELKELRDSNPLVTGSLLRLLIAILHRAVNGPANMNEWTSVWKRGQFESFKYLEAQQQRFDLFNSKYPFYQKSGLVLKKEVEIDKLFIENKNDETLFYHRESGRSYIPFPLAARQLVTAQAFSIGFGKSEISDASGKVLYQKNGPLVSGWLNFLVGENLFETLVLNLLVYKPERDEPIPAEPQVDCPIWETDGPEPCERAPRGWLDWLTWQSRMIRLLGDEHGVYAMYFGPGVSLPADFEVWDPFWFLKLNSQGERRPVCPRVDRAIWRDCTSLFSLAQVNTAREERPRAFRQAANAHDLGVLPRRMRKCMLVGLRRDIKQASKLEAWSCEVLPVPSEFLDGGRENILSLSTGINISEKAYDVLDKALKKYANLQAWNGVKESKPNKDSVKKIRAKLSTFSYWSLLSNQFNLFLGEVVANGAGAVPGWSKYVWKVGMDVFDDAMTGVGSRGARTMMARARAKAELEENLRDLLTEVAEVAQL